MFGRIRLRLTLWYVTILILIVVLFGTIVVLGFRYQVKREQENLLAREAESKQGDRLRQRARRRKYVLHQLQPDRVDGARVGRPTPCTD